MRNSKRYKNYIRVKIHEYQLALVDVLHRDASDLIEQLGLHQVLRDLRDRIVEPNKTATHRLIEGTHRLSRSRKPPGKISAEVFNNQSEIYYRTTLKRVHTQEGYAVLRDACVQLERENSPLLNTIMQCSDQTCHALDLLKNVEEAILDEKADPVTLRCLIHICLAVITRENNLDKTIS